MPESGQFYDQIHARLGFICAGTKYNDCIGTTSFEQHLNEAAFEFAKSYFRKMLLLLFGLADANEEVMRRLCKAGVVDVIKLFLDEI